MSGWLQKKAGLLSASKRRFFVLENSKLLYYLSADTSKQAQGFIDVHQVLRIFFFFFFFFSFAGFEGRIY
jgi:hypothetical protein